MHSEKKKREKDGCRIELLDLVTWKDVVVVIFACQSRHCLHFSLSVIEQTEIACSQDTNMHSKINKITGRFFGKVRIKDTKTYSSCKKAVTVHMWKLMIGGQGRDARAAVQPDVTPATVAVYGWSLPLYVGGSVFCCAAPVLKPQPLNSTRPKH